MAGFASLFTDFDMFKIYLKKLFLLANSVALFTYTEAWLDMAQTHCQISLYFKKKKKKEKKAKFCCVCSPYNQNYFEVIKSLSELQNIFDSAQMRSHPLDQSWKWIHSKKTSVTRERRFQMN